MVPDRKLCCTALANSGIMPPMKYWEIVADKLSAAGYYSAVTGDGRRWIVDAHREGRRYIVHSGGLPSAFLWLKSIGLKRKKVLDCLRVAGKLKPITSPDVSTDVLPD